jgi:hypothetical protein
MPLQTKTNGEMQKIDIPKKKPLILGFSAAKVNRV